MFIVMLGYIVSSRPAWDMQTLLPTAIEVCLKGNEDTKE